ncbi:unnamed protein product, partial [marine sediment metagenome]
ATLVATSGTKCPTVSREDALLQYVEMAYRGKILIYEVTSQ